MAPPEGPRIVIPVEIRLNYEAVEVTETSTPSVPEGGRRSVTPVAHEVILPAGDLAVSKPGQWYKGAYKGGKHKVGE